MQGYMGWPVAVIWCIQYFQTINGLATIIHPSQVLKSISSSHKWCISFDTIQISSYVLTRQKYVISLDERL